MEPTRSLEQLTDGELLLRLADILRQSRRNEADLVAHIAEVDARRLYAREASPSMFAYCTERLHLSEAEAYLRIAAARAGRYRVQFTASAGLRDKLERLQALLRSSIPGADLAAVIEDAVTEKLERLEARRFGLTKAPRTTLSQTETKPASRHIEFHHRHPFAMGGDHSPHGIALACKAHNLYLAEVDFGRAAIRVAHPRLARAAPGVRGAQAPRFKARTADRAASPRGARALPDGPLPRQHRAARPP